MNKTISDVADVIDCLHTTPTYTKDGFPVTRVEDIGEKYIDFNNCLKVSNETCDFMNKKYKPQIGDIVITRVGSFGRMSYVHSNQKFCLGQNISIIHPKIDSRFLYYYLNSPYAQKFIYGNSNGSSYKSLSLEQINNIPLSVEGLKIEKIGKLLDDIDMRIHVNKKINAELESMAKTIYAYWFLQFEFPNEEGKPYKSSGGKMVWNDELKREIPEGWEVKQIGEILKETDKSRIQVNGAKETGKYPFFTSGESILALDDYFVDGFNIFLNTGGNPDIKAFMGKCAYSTDTWCISANEHSLLLYYYLLKLMPQFEQLFFAGSGLKHLQKDMLKSKFILLPDKKTLSKFNLCCKSSWKQIANTFIQNQELASLRDFLLPMLMNGQVTFKDEVKA